jgi:hypothetical protein
MGEQQPQRQMQPTSQELHEPIAIPSQHYIVIAMTIVDCHDIHFPERVPLLRLCGNCTQWKAPVVRGPVEQLPQQRVEQTEELAERRFGY